MHLKNNTTKEQTVKKKKKPTSTSLNIKQPIQISLAIVVKLYMIKVLTH